MPKPKVLADFGPIQLAEFAGLYRVHVTVGVPEKFVPGPDLPSGRWSRALAEQIAADAPDIRIAYDEYKARARANQPIGWKKAAARVAERTGLTLDWSDIQQAETLGLLTAVDHYDDVSLYSLSQLDALAAETMAGIVAERLSWTANSTPRKEAAAQVGLLPEELDAEMQRRGVQLGRFRRYPAEAVEALALDDEACGRVIGERQLNSTEAADLLGIRQSDFVHVVAAGWLRPCAFGEVVDRRNTITFALYRRADVLAVLQVPGVDWPAVQATGKGAPSVLMPVVRALLITRAAARIGEQYQVQVDAEHHEDTGRWVLAWETFEGVPTAAQVAADLDRDTALAAHRHTIQLDPAIEETHR